MPTFENDYNSALSAAGKRAKKVYVRTHNAVYELNSKQAEKVVKDWVFRDPDASLQRHGTKILVMYQGSFTKHPVTDRYPEAIKYGTPIGNIVQYLAIDGNDIHFHAGLKNQIKERQFPEKNDMRHYKAMVATSKKVGWPTSFATDMTTHDRRDLTYRSPTLPLGWILRPSGTNIVYPEMDVSMTNNKHAPPSAWLKIMQGSYGMDECKFYVWDGTALQEKRPETWGEWVDAKQRFMRGDKE